MPPKAGRSSQVKFGKLLAVGMTIALIWGIILLVTGIYVQFKFGSVITALIGNLEKEVNTKAAQNDAGQNIAPVAPIDDDVNMGNWSKLMSYLIMSSAILTILFSCLGIYSGLNHNKMVLVVTVLVLVVAAVLIIYLISMTADYDASFHVNARSELIEFIHKSYTVETLDNSFVFALNSIMLWFQCCGISSVRDFHNLTFLEVSGHSKDPKEVNFKIAPACCSRHLFNLKGDPMPSYQRIKDCAEKGYDDKENLEHNVNNKGCYNELFNAVSGTASAFFALILIWDILVLVLAILTIMEIKPSEEPRISLEKERAEAERKRMEEIALKEKEEMPAVKKFVPYAKVSSFVHTDVSRIKSTEIWHSVCGIQGPRNFINLTFINEDQNNEIVYFKISPACCKRHLFNKNPMETFSELRRCSINGSDNINRVNTQGCYSTIFHHISENYGVLVAVSLISLAIWEIVQLILAVLIIFTPPPRRTESHRSTVHTKSVVEIEEKPKKFVP